MINALTSLRNVFNSLARIVENSGSPDPLTLAKYEASIVETAPRTATAAPSYKKLELEISCRGEKSYGVRVPTKLQHQW